MNKIFSRYCRTADLPSSGHDGQTSDEQQSQGSFIFFIICYSVLTTLPQVSLSTLSPILFREHALASTSRKFLSLFPGLGYAAGYKVSQRIYKFGGQPYFNDLLNSHYRSSFTNTFGERKGKMMMQATAGSLTGIGEVVLLPLDVLKIKRQVNPDAFRGRGIWRIILEERGALYSGWGWTMARNAPGSFAVRFFVSFLPLSLSNHPIIS